jgi:hypothetical protein
MREVFFYAATALIVCLLAPLLLDVMIARPLALRGPFDCGTGYVVAGCWEQRR